MGAFNLSLVVVAFQTSVTSEFVVDLRLVLTQENSHHDALIADLSPFSTSNVS